MAIGRRIKGLFVLFMTAVLFLTPLSADAAELGFGRATADDFVSEETSFNGTDAAEPNAVVLPDDGPIGHAFRSGGRVVVEKATCVKNGKKTEYCAVSGCKASHNPRVTILGRDQNNHAKWKSVDTPSTCTKKGQAGWKCDACGRSEITDKALLPHNYNNLLYTQPGNCSNRASETRSCSCGARTVVYTNYGDHVTYYVYKAPTTESEGWEGYECYYCNNYKKVIATYPKLTPKDPEPMPGTDEPSIPSQPSNPGTQEPTPNDPNTPNQDSQTSSAKTADNVKNSNVGTIYAGDPVNVFTGAHEIDFKVVSAGGAQNLSVGLSYKSNKTIESIFGKGFSWNYESFVEEKDGKILLYHSPSEYVTYSKENGNSFYTTEAKGSENDRLYKNTDNTVSLKSDGKSFDYNTSGKLVRFTAKTGISSSIEYKEGETVLRDEVSGQTITLFFNDKNLVEKVAGSGTAEAYFEYDDKKRLVKFTDVDGFVTEYTYDDYDRVLTGTDHDGNVFFENTYDEEGRIVKQKDASENEAYFSYTDNGEDGKTTVFTDRNGNTKTHIFSKEGRLFSFTDEEGGTTHNEYDEGGNCIKQTDALGNSVFMEYDDKHNLVKTTDALGNTTKFAYDENDNLIKVTYSNGSEVSNTYDSNNRLVSTTDVRGLTTTNTYDDNGFLIKTESGDKVSEFTYENGMLKTVTDSLGNVTEYTYDDNGNLIETKTPDGAVVSQTVSDFGAVKSTTDALGNVKDYIRNCFDKPLTVTDEVGYVTEYSYDERQLLKESKDSKKNVTTYTYDNEERLVKTTYPDATYTENVYDKAGRLVETVDAEGNRAYVEYDKAGRVVKETDREGNSTEISYDKNGNVISRKDAKGNVTTYTYDEMGRVSTVTNAFNGVTEYTYNDAGDLLSVKDPMGNVSSYTYDIYGRKTSETDPNGNVTRFKYDLNGNLIKSIDALNNETIFEYDECNRLVSTKKGEVVIALEYDLNGRGIATTDPLGHRSETVYDERGYASVKKDALGNETSYTYDSNGNLVSVTDANGHTTTYAVNDVNQVTSVTDALELTTSFAYDKNGRRNKSTNPMNGVSTSIFDKTGNALILTGPEGATTDFTYDANGNLTSRSTVAGNSVKYTYNALNLAESYVNGRGQSTTYEYDLSGRIVKSVSPEGTVTYTYDGNSNVLTVTDASGSISRTYDALNRVTSVTDTKGRTVSYEYDLYGNLKTLTYPDNTSVTYTYDLCGNIKTVTDWEGRVTAYTYDALNRETETNNSNNYKVKKEYDAVGNLVKKSVYKISSGQLFDETVYVYDEINRLVSESYTKKDYCYEYSYDNLSRVVKRITKKISTGKQTDEETYDYDGAGNITTDKTWINTHNNVYAGEDNRMQKVNDYEFTFDNDGNMISGLERDPKSISFYDGTVGYSYDSKNRLTERTMREDGYFSVNKVKLHIVSEGTFRANYDAEDYRTSTYTRNRTYTVDSSATSGSVLLESTAIKDGELLTKESDTLISDTEGDTDEIQSDINVSEATDAEEADAAETEKEDTDISIDTSENDVSEECDESDNSGEAESGGADVSENLPETEDENEDLTGEAVQEETGLTEEPAREGEETLETTEEQSEEKEFEEQVEDTAEAESEEAADLPLEEEKVTESISDRLTLKAKEIQDDADIDDSKPGAFNAKISKDGSLVPGFNGDGETHGIMGTSFSIPQTDVITEQSYCYDRENKNLLVSYKEDGTIKKYVYGNGLISTDERNDSDGSMTFLVYLYDLRGSVTEEMDASGNKKGEYRYSTYGIRTTISGATTEVGYCGRDGVLSDGVGLLYMRARYYNPHINRFINQDIITGDISNSNSLNRYAYVEGNPATMIDPFGLCPGKGNAESAYSPLAYGKATASFETGSLTYEQKKTNAVFIARYLLDRGWTLEAICGALGNFEKESGLNPGMWAIGRMDDINAAYGLDQSTPLVREEKKYYRFTSWFFIKEDKLLSSDEAEEIIDCKKLDLIAVANPERMISLQLEYMFEVSTEQPIVSWNFSSRFKDENGNPITKEKYDMSLESYKNSARQPEELAMTFMACHEKPSVGDAEKRKDNARNWYKELVPIFTNLGGLNN